MATSTPDKLHWEDFRVGEAIAYGSYPVTKEDIFEFAHAYDPQPHHIDEEAAKLSLVKGLCASGWHSCAMMMRMLADGVLNKSAALGAAGIDEVRWMKPVRPGHILKARTTCLEKRLMRSRKGVGIAKFKHELFNQSDELLMMQENSVFLAVRDPAAAEAAAASQGAGR
ncbi:MAG: MaoC family dehydratase [Proteobacteria bacterium]|nr:MaoC family dehydratase [Pseudomonadota bacterium]